MKKRSLRILALCLALSMSATVFAEETTLGEVEAGEVTNTAGPEEIPVYGTYSAGTPDGEIVISADVKWSSMQFTYVAEQQGAWDVTSHQYGDTEYGQWSKDTADITLVNHSNTDVAASLAYEQHLDTVYGNFDSTEVSLDTAEETTVEEAPSETVTFTVSGFMKEGDSDLGVITVTLDEHVPAVLDLTGVELSEYAATISTYLAKSGATNLSVAVGTEELSINQASQLCNAIKSAGVSALTVTDVTSVAENAFSSETSLTAISLPEATDLSSMAFNACNALESVDLPKVTKLSGNYIFSGCTSLKSVNLPELTTVAGNYVFKGCSSLASVDLPKLTSVTGKYIFIDCSALTTVNVPELLTVGYGMFSKCTGLSTIELPKATSIDVSAFEGCTWLSVVFAESVLTIDECAFADCSSMRTAAFSSVTTVGEWAFSNATSLESVHLPAATSVGAYAFRYCSNLTSMYFGAVLTNVDMAGWGDSSFGFYPENITLTLNGSQGDINGNTTTWGDNGTFNGQTYKTINKVTLLPGGF